MKEQGRHHQSAAARFTAWAWQGPRWRVFAIVTPAAALFVAGYLYLLSSIIP
jgi:hypothetical protein